jgi:hypothetical protein
LRRQSHVIIACAALFLAVVLPGNAAGVPLGGMTVCLLPLVDLTPEGNLGEYANVITQDLGVQLQQAGVPTVAAARVAEVIASQKVSAHDLLAPRAAAAAALAAGGDIAVNGYIALEDDTLKVSLRAYDAKTGILLAGLLRDLQFNISLYAFLWQAVSEMLAQAAPAPAPAEPAAAPSAAAAAAPALHQPAGAVVFTSSQDGVEVLLSDGTSLGRIEKGALTVPAAGIDLRAPLVLEKRLDGYHSARQTARPAPVVALSPIARSNNFAIEAQWTEGQLIGAGAAFRFYLSPDYLFLSPSVYVSAQPPTGSGGNTVTHLDAGFLVGEYLFFPPDFPFRLGVSAGTGAILSWSPAPGVPVFFDPYMDIVNLWIELNLQQFSISLRSDLKYALGGPTPNLLGQGLILWAGFLPPISLGVTFKW